MKKIPLTRGFTALVSDRDFKHLSQFKWQSLIDKNTVYAVRTIRVGSRRTCLLMHRAILGCASDEKVDHRDGNGLNNQRSNLRIATVAQNCHNARIKKNNKTGLKGVNFRPNGKYRARIWIGGKNHSLGLFTSPEEANAAYAAAARKNFQTFARCK